MTTWTLSGEIILNSQEFKLYFPGSKKNQRCVATSALGGGLLLRGRTELTPHTPTFQLWEEHHPFPPVFYRSCFHHIPGLSWKISPWKWDDQTRRNRTALLPTPWPSFWSKPADKGLKDAMFIFNLDHHTCDPLLFITIELRSRKHQTQNSWYHCEMVLYRNKIAWGLFFLNIR